MVGGRPMRPLPHRHVLSEKIALIRSIFMFVISAVASYWVGTRIGYPAALLALIFFWLTGALNFLKNLFRFVSITGDEAIYHDMLRRADIMQQPNTEKTSDVGENDWLSFGVSCMQGWRRTMEDDHVTLLTEDGGFFGVFDGHSGASVAKFCGGNIFDFVQITTAFREGNYIKALYDGFIAIDKHLHVNYGNEKSGCTAVVLFVKGDDLYCSNAGDSRSILCRDGEPVALSMDHKPFLPAEQSRIEKAGGYVLNRRVNGALALSRAIGDFSFKCNTRVTWDQQAVTSAPEVCCSRLNRNHDEFAVIACDGIWDVLSNDQVVDFVRSRISRRVPLDKIAEELLDRCLSPQPFGLGCDNMSVVIVLFKRSIRNQSSSIATQETVNHTGVEFHGTNEVQSAASSPKKDDTHSNSNVESGICAALSTEGASAKESLLPQSRYEKGVLDILDYSAANADLLLQRDSRFMRGASEELFAPLKEKQE